MDTIWRAADPLSRQDAGYLARERDGQPMQFVLLSEVAPDGDAPVTIDVVRDHIAARLHAVPGLRRKVLVPPLDIGPHRWVDDVDFAVERHVRPWPEVDDDPTFLAGLRTATEHQLDRDRPLWEIRVAPPRSDGHAAISFAVHHALADGGAMRHILGVLFGPPPQHARTALEWHPRPAPSSVRLLAYGVGGALRHRIRTISRAPAVASRVPVEPSDTALAGPVGPRRAIELLSYPLSAVRRARRRTGATINDLYLTAVTSGLRNLMDSRGQLDDDLTLTALVPRDVRSEEEAAAVGNRTWSMFVDLPIGVVHTEELLDRVQRATRRAKETDRSWGNEGFRFDVAVSNAPLGGPHRVAEHPILQHHASVPLQGENRLAILALSTGDAFTITFTADADAFPDLGVLVDGTRAGFTELLSVAEEDPGHELPTRTTCSYPRSSS